MIATRTMTSSLLVRGAFPHLPNRTLALLAVVGATGIWGSSAVATKAALVDLPPLTVAFARLPIAYLVLRPLVARTGR